MTKIAVRLLPMSIPVIAWKFACHSGLFQVSDIKKPRQKWRGSMQKKRSVEQGVKLTAIFRRQGIAGAQRRQDLLEHLPRLAVGGGKIALQVTKQ